MGVYIPDMDMPRCCRVCPFSHIWEYDDETSCILGGCWHPRSSNKRNTDCPLVEVKAPHGRLIDADALRARMYHEAFETDSDMQKWESGCWIRYKMFERMEEAAPTIIEAEGKDDG